MNQPTMAPTAPTPTKLSDKAMLVKLSIKRAALTKRDHAITTQVQQQYGDQSLTVLTQLFKDKSSPIRQIVSAANEVYAYHRKHTIPYIDAGPRILPSSNYFEYTQDVKQLITRVDRLIEDYMPYYDQMVQDDISYRRQAAQATGKTSSAHVDDYPTAETFANSMAIEYRFSPMPDARHFLFDMSDEDLEVFNRAEADAVAAANADVVGRMLTPIRALVERLAEYHGEKGQRWHNSIIQNVIDGCNLAESLAIDPSPEFLSTVSELRDTARGYLEDVELVKASPTVRKSAQDRLAEVAKKMEMFS